MITYLDDWLILHHNVDTLLTDAAQVIQKTLDLGWIINTKKSDLVPKNVFEFIGLEINTTLFTVRPTEKRLTDLQIQISLFRNALVTVADIMRMQGILISLGEIVPLGKLNRRKFQQSISHIKTHKLKKSQKITVTQTMKSALRWWKDNSHARIGVEIRIPPPQITITTDASHHGWGGVCEHNLIKGIWKPNIQKWHINALEMQAVIETVKHFLAKLKGKHVLLMTDNTTVLAYIKHEGGTVSKKLSDMTGKLLRLAHRHQIVITPSHISTDLNVLADRLSRKDKPVSTEWKLNKHIFRRICGIDKPEVDMFATRWNHQLPLYISPCPDTMALGTNGLVWDWKKYAVIYAFPPKRILAKVIEKIEMFRGKVLLIAPLNKQCPLHQRMIELSIDSPRKIPNVLKLLTQRARTGNTAPKSRGPAASRVELIKRSLESQGISTKIAEAAAKPQRESSIKRYEHIWKKYADWYHKKWSEDPCTTSVIRLAEYLLKLKDSKLSYATIATHKSAICRTLTSLGKCNPGNNYVIRDLLKNFQKTIKRNDYSIPDWNFTVVLMALTKAPFEPLSDIDVKYLTMKTLFLTTWASAARCSEIQALTIADGHYMRDHENRYIDLVPNTSFIAKNQLTTEVPRRYRIQSLKDFVGPAETEALLCPVRALRIYVKRTKEIRDNTQQLFINPNKNNGMAKHSISYWLKRCIKLAYEISEPQLLKTLHRVMPHEIRAMATTLAVNKHVPIQSIMKKAYWKTDTSFTSFYFKDIAKYVKNDVGLQTTAAGYCLQL